MKNHSLSDLTESTENINRPIVFNYVLSTTFSEMKTLDHTRNHFAVEVDHHQDSQTT